MSLFGPFLQRSRIRTVGYWCFICYQSGLPAAFASGSGCLHRDTTAVLFLPTMPSTSASLLERLRVPEQQDAWHRFVDLYTPLIVAWGRRVGLQGADAADLTQEVLCVAARVLPTFEYNKNGSFRAWLQTITLNKWRERERRAKLPIDPLAIASEHPTLDDPIREFWENEYRERITARALQLMRSEFQESTWRAFWGVVVQSRAGDEVAAELGISVAAVYAAKGRVLRRLRSELAGLTD